MQRWNREPLVTSVHVATLSALAFVAIGAYQPACDFPKNDWMLRLAAPHDTSCICDANWTMCKPHEICYSVPIYDDPSAGSEAVPDSFACYKRPCDDISGKWIWIGRLPKPWIPGDFTVWATVEVEQENCNAVMVIKTSVDESGPLDTIETRLSYATLSGPELYFIDIFSTKEERDEYFAFDGDEEVWEQMQDGRVVFIQDFGNGAPPPDQQCTYYGSFVYPMSKMSNLDESVPSYSGSLVRDVSNEYNIGDIIPEDIGSPMFSNRNCPEGYPRVWSGEEGNGSSSSSSSSSSEGEKSGESSQGCKRCKHLALFGSLVVALLLWIVSCLQ